VPSTTPAQRSWQAELAGAIAEAGQEPGVQTLAFGSVLAGSPHPSDVDLALVYEPGHRGAALQLRERLRSAVLHRLDLACDFIVVSRAEAEQERRQPQLRDDIFRDLASVELDPVDDA
jgi:predicted nucleotidyltransferase